ARGGPARARARARRRRRRRAGRRHRPPLARGAGSGARRGGRARLRAGGAAARRRAVRDARDVLAERLRVSGDLPGGGPMSAAVPFTPEQQAAIAHDGGLLLTANAGRGKTSVMAERYVRLASEPDADVGRILAITFTEKAAAE